MHEIGIFICNYNKAEMIIKCVQAVLEQTYQDFDIYVVDNASTDNSVEMLRSTYGDRVTIIQNPENLGGSGGFGRGIRTALEMDYKYFMLVDNDAFMDRRAVEYLHDYIDSHEDAGICGAETLYLQDSNKIQDLGGKLDYVNYRWGGIIGGMVEMKGSAVLECDYVASCCVMARTSAVRVFGGFPEENFIYWDDIEWCTKCWRAGFKVVVNGNAKVLHDMSGASRQNMFLRYYANRNRLKFFTRYLPGDRLEDFYMKFTEQFFLESYGAMYKGMTGSVMTLWNALDDFMHGVTGKAADGRQVPYTRASHRLLEIARASKRVLVCMPTHTQEDYDSLNLIMRKMTNENPDLEIKVQFGVGIDDVSGYDAVFRLCDHATKVKDNILPIIYIDRYENIIENEGDFLYFSSYERALANFRKMYRPLFDERVRDLR
jgi:hypothetical protein